jgi:hypothetical protein
MPTTGDDPPDERGDRHESPPPRWSRRDRCTVDRDEQARDCGHHLGHTCGQSVSGIAVLAADLDCSAGPDPAIDLASGARLYLQGFTLTADHTGVQCELGSCKIIGPGTIRRNAPDGTDSTGVLGIRRAKLYSVTLENWARGMFVLGPGDLRDSTVLNNYYGAMAGPLRATDTSFVGNEYGTRANEGTKDGVHYIFWPQRIKRCTFTGNTIDLSGYKRPNVRDSNCTTSDQLTIPQTPWSGGDEWGVCP